MILSKNKKLISTGTIPILIPENKDKYTLFIFNNGCERYELEFKFLTRCFKFNENFAFEYISKLDDNFYFISYNGIITICDTEPWK